MDELARVWIGYFLIGRRMEIVGVARSPDLMMRRMESARIGSPDPGWADGYIWAYDDECHLYRADIGERESAVVATFEIVTAESAPDLSIERG